ncbi:Bromodomain-containing protein, partial [Catenaria anguillulae PL171]
MSQAQYKHLLSTLRSIKRLKDAAPFTAPVDWKALNLPDYPLIIKRPMDLKTMEAKLQAKEYTLVDQVIADFDTMVDNCVRYNGEKSIYSAMARKIRQSLDKHLERLPPPDPSSPGLAAFGSSVASSARSSTSSLPSAVGGGASTPGAASAVAAANAAARNQHEMDAALAVVRELFKRQYQEFAAPFLVPVDRRMYPQYYETIRQPMDFGTIRERLEAGGHYASAAQVEADCNLVFKNCFKFNPPGNPVRSMGMKLEALFKGLWANRSTMIPPLP